MHKFTIKEAPKLDFSYDHEADAAYIRVRPGKVHKTVETGPGIMLDFDSSNNLLGIEILCPRQIEINSIMTIAKKFDVPVLKHVNPRAIPELYAA